MSRMDLGPVTRITTDAVGEPGARVFYLQASAPLATVTVVVEKQQIELLSASILELLADLELETGQGPGEEQMSLEEPFEPRWRAGKLSIGYDQDQDLFVLEIEEFRPEDDQDDDDVAAAPIGIVDEAESVRLFATSEQMLALSRHGAAVAQRGRPTCQYCGNPMDPEGHACPAMNGHSKRD
jgi:uncharacterized repeat protein (TIGR03847 family)